MTPDEIEAARKLFAGPCDFVWGAKEPGNLPPDRLPEVAFVGRSNVGKSSLVNALTGRRTLARVSQTPGATRQINFFDLGHRLMLADLPGYGFAKVSKTEAAAWQELIFSYLRGRASLRRALVLIDARRGIMDTDSQVLGLLNQAAVSTLVVLTKFDQLAKAEREAVQAAVTAETSRHTVALEQVIATSAETGEGIPFLRAHLLALAAG
ncbi:MAG TPA: ribosome biogenesis GTP-binding protein YihA/YsxC [Rhizomicrobium sp.]|nr:ribosome biogenesis GTP-binding protein YihA/YsxC [Rhizomicrobium sp.]